MAGEAGKGFEIVLDPDMRILRVRVWGLWDNSFMQKYENAFNEKAEELQLDGNGWSALVDMSALCSHSDEIQEEFCQQFAAAAELGMNKLACIGQGSVPPLQFNRLFLSHAIKTCLFAASEEEAFQWLEKNDKDVV